jgi:thiol-disulfide isomerase/thioredoxin
MTLPQPIDNDTWVDDRLRALAPPDGWHPNATERLPRLHARRARLHARRLRRLGLAVAAAIVFVAVPVTRAFGTRCLEACVNVTTRVTQFFHADEPEATAPKVVGAAIGNVAPDELGADASGVAHTTSALRGRVVVINFWATWCGPCRAEIPLLNDLQARYGAGGLNVVGVSFDEDGWAAVNPFLAQTPVRYTMLMGNDRVAAAFGGADALPVTFIVTRDGVIAAKSAGAIRQGMYDDLIERLLAASPGK